MAKNKNVPVVDPNAPTDQAAPVTKVKKPKASRLYVVNDPTSSDGEKLVRAFSIATARNAITQHITVRRATVDDALANGSKAIIDGTVLVAKEDAAESSAPAGDAASDAVDSETAGNGE